MSESDTHRNLGLNTRVGALVLMLGMVCASAGQVTTRADVEAAKKETFVVINQAMLKDSLGTAFDSVLGACSALVKGNDGRILDAGKAYQQQFGKSLAVDYYRVFFSAPGEATVKARWLCDWLARSAGRGSTVILLGDEKSLPTWQLQIGKTRLTTDSLYCDLNRDGIPETAVARILGTADTMVCQLRGKKNYGSKAVILCSEDTRIHLETRAFAKRLSRLGYEVAIRGARDDEALTSSDFIIHFGHGRPSRISNRFGETFVADSSMPALPRCPIVFVDGCGTLPVGSGLLSSFLKQGALAYVGSTATVQGMFPARFTNELVEHFLRLHAERPHSSIPELLTAARAAYVLGHPGLSDMLSELAVTGRIDASGDELIHLLTVAEWVYYGDPRAVMPRTGSPKQMSRPAFSVTAPIRLDKTRHTWQMSYESKTDDGQAILSLYADIPLSERESFCLAILQNGRELLLLDARHDTLYQRIGRDCRGGYVSGRIYCARFLVPLSDGQGQQQVGVRLVKGSSAVLVPPTEVEIWPRDFAETIRLRR
jgi:hypothetical protein